MGASLVGLGLLLAGSQVQAQNQLCPEPMPEVPKTLHFTKPANTAQLPVKKPIQAQQQAPTVPHVLPPVVGMPNPVLPSVNPAAKLVRVPSPQGIIQQTFYQQKGGLGGFIPPPAEETAEYLIQLVPPGPQRVFRLESEQALQERIRQEAKERPTPERVGFPEEPVVGRGPYVQRAFPERHMLVEPNYVCYNRLFFEEKNSERYGWDLGFIQPFVSAGEFYWDLATLPYHFWTEPCRHYECSAGYCLPGDPVPYLIYPPQLSMSGAIAEAGTVVGLLAIFP
jgi:hypothetical protein